MVATVVNSIAASTNNLSRTTLSVILDWTPTIGNMLIGFCAGYTADRVNRGIGSPTFIDLFESATGEGPENGVYRRVVTGIETEVIFSVALIAPFLSTRQTACVLEIAGFDAGNPIDSSTDNYWTDGTALGATAATPATSAGLALVLWNGEKGAKWKDGGGTSIGDGFTEVLNYYGPLSDQSPHIIVGYKAYTSASEVSVTLATGDTGGPNRQHLMFIPDDPGVSAVERRLPPLTWPKA